MARVLTILLLVSALLLHAGGALLGVERCGCTHDEAATVPSGLTPFGSLPAEHSEDCLRCPTGCPCCEGAAVRTAAGVVEQTGGQLPDVSDGAAIPGLWKTVSLSRDSVWQLVASPPREKQPQSVLNRSRVLLL